MPLVAVQQGTLLYGGVIMKNIVSKLNFAMDLVNSFNDYSNILDVYFSLEENRENNKELFIYYQDLRDNIINLSKKYNIKDWK